MGILKQRHGYVKRERMVVWQGRTYAVQKTWDRWHPWRVKDYSQAFGVNLGKRATLGQAFEMLRSI